MHLLKKSNPLYMNAFKFWKMNKAFFGKWELVKDGYHWLFLCILSVVWHCAKCKFYNNTNICEGPKVSAIYMDQ